MASIRLLVQIAVQYDLSIHRVDDKSAYLNAPLDYEIYVELPEGFEGKNGNYVWELKKSLHGLKQIGQTWNKTFHTYLTTKISCSHLWTPACMFKMSTIKYP